MILENCQTWQPDYYAKTLHENICFCVREIKGNFGAEQAGKTYMKTVMDFVEG